MSADRRGGSLLSVRGLSVEFWTGSGPLRAVNDISYDVRPGRVLGIVGESGSGKSAGVLSLLGLLPRTVGRVVAGEALFEGRDLFKLPRKALRQIRGGEIGFIFQDPMTSLNPVLTIGWQLTETIRAHQGVSRAEAKKRAIELLRSVHIPSPEIRFGEYPVQFSGGMRQRAMIAMAIANQPKLLIADEPTTALDVTVQAQIVDILREAQRRTGAATILISHDLGLVAEMAQDVLVMYAGRIIESGPVDQVFSDPRHPYTRGLLASRPRLDVDEHRLTPVRGAPPQLDSLPPGCAFAPRCDLSQDREVCLVVKPPLQRVADGRLSACHFSDELEGSAPGAPASVSHFVPKKGRA